MSDPATQESPHARQERAARAPWARLNPLALFERLTGRRLSAGAVHFYKDSLLYSIANLLPRALGYVLWPVIAFMVTPSGYAIFSNYNSAILVLTIILSAQVQLSVARYYYEEKEDFPDFLGTQFFFTLALAAAMLVPLWLFRETWAGLFEIPPLVFGLAVAAALTQIAHQVYTQILLARKRSKSYLIYQFAIQILYVALAIGLLLAVYHFRLLATPDRYLALVVANLLAFVPLAVLFLYFLVRMMRPVFRLDHLRYALRLTLPGIPGALSLAALNYFDRVYISQFSLDLAGKYAFAYQLAMLISMVSSGLFSAYMPRFYEHRNREAFGEIQSLFTRNLRLLLAASAVLILLSGPVALLIGSRNPAYLESMPVIPIIITGYLFVWLGQCHGLYVSFRRKFIFLQSMTLVAAAAANVGLNVWLLPRYGFEPKVAALNTLAAFFLQWALCYLISRFLLRERMAGFQGSRAALAAYFAFATLWVYFGY